MSCVYSVPPHIVNVYILNTTIIKTVGSELSLMCDVDIVDGVISNVQIVWMKNGTRVEETNNSRITIFRNDSDHSSTLQFLHLYEDDENMYTCNVTVHDISIYGLVYLNDFYCKFVIAYKYSVSINYLFCSTSS